MSKPISIYGLFSGDRCLYVGRTGNVKARTQSHGLRFRHLPSPPIFRVIKKVSAEVASQSEARTIRCYRSRGEAEFNIKLVPRVPVRQILLRVRRKMAAGITAAAARNGISLSLWMREAAEEKMAREVAAK